MNEHQDGDLDEGFQRNLTVFWVLERSRMMDKNQKVNSNNRLFNLILEVL